MLLGGYKPPPGSSSFFSFFFYFSPMGESPPTLLVFSSAIISALAFAIILISFPLLKDELEYIEAFGHDELLLIREQSDYLWKELLTLGVHQSPEGRRKARALSTAAYVAPPAPPSEDEILTIYEDEVKEEDKTPVSPPLHTFKSRLQLKSYGEPLSEYGYAYTKLKCCCVGATGPGQNENLPTSYKCPAGKPGPQGESGLPGVPGERGHRGFPGLDAPPAYIIPLPCVVCPQGPPGNSGCKGSPGARGSRGVNGPRGNGGIPGVQGPLGPTGESGSRGTQGRPGVKGAKGADGIKGAKGVKGLPGIPGLQGVIGPAGVGGRSGEYGVPGVPGPCGNPGNKGGPGQDGASGETGVQGSPGDDGGYCACPPKSLPGVYSVPKPAPGYAPPQPYYSTNYQNNGPSVLQPYYTTPTTQSPLQYPSSTHIPTHYNGGPISASLDQSAFHSNQGPWSSNSRFVLETSTYGVDNSFFPIKKRRRSLTVRRVSQ